MVDSPAQLKNLTIEQLTPLAEEIRQELITVLSKTAVISARTWVWWN